MSNPVRTRRSIWLLEQANPWDPYTLAYARAVGEMKKRQPSDPTSWEAQAQIHGRLCQHQTWFFLPWHRMYILWFERIVQALVAQQPGAPRDWALPYWNWQANRVMPPAFRARNMPDGSPNPLFLQDRASQINAGLAMAAAVVDSTLADASPVFTAGRAASFGFGGGDTHGPSHFSGGQTGLIEAQPHNNVHRTVNGTMATALSSLDPIFWLHHAQVDRMWGIWLRRGGGRANPTDSSWLTQKFQFVDPNGQPVTQTPADVLSKTRLGYRYDDDPPRGMRPLPSVAPRIAARHMRMLADVRGDGQPQELGTSGPVRLDAGATTAAIELADAPGAHAESFGDPEPGTPQAVALVLEGIEPDDLYAPMYEVYVNAPEGEAQSGAHESPYFAGFLEFFGADHSHGEHEEHEHHQDAPGLTRVFDITSLAHQLAERDAWNPAELRVSFVPASLFEEPETGERQAPQLERTPDVKIEAIRVVTE